MVIPSPENSEVCSPPQWSGDGEELAGVVRASTGFSVEVVSTRTRESRRLTLPGRTRRLDLSWSPDGRFFAYVDAYGPYNDVSRLWLLNLADGEALAVTDGQTKVWSPSWSSDGRTLFFLSNRGGSMDLWQQALGPEGSLEGDPLPVTAGIGMRHAFFSPDGTKLAYSRGRLVANLWRVPILEDRPATWADAAPLTSDYARVEYVDVSPDGKRLAIASDRSGNMDLWTLPVGGGEMMPLTTDRAPDWSPKWSPDGLELAFTSYRSGNREIWVMPAAGGPARRVTREEPYGNRHSWFPVWAPDGQEMAFLISGSGSGGIFVIPSEGGEPRRVTAGTRPRWSPDGKWLAFNNDRRIWRVPAAGGDPEPLRLTSGPGVDPRWSLDGTLLFFTGVNDREGDLWALSLEDGSERPMTDLAGKRGSLHSVCLATDGQYLYFCWDENLGDIWVMDVVTDESE